MTRPPASALIAAVLAAALLLPAVARAEPNAGKADTSQASDEDRTVARRHFLRGKELHAEGKYRDAATEYLAAYERFPAPAFLYNVAQVYRLAGDRRAALENYRKYLELEPDGEGSADAREFVATLEAAIAADGDSGAAHRSGSAASDEPAGASDPIDPIQHSNLAGERDLGDLGTSPGRNKKIIGVALGAAGVVALGVAVGFAFKARSDAGEISDYRGPWTSVQEATYKDGQSAERTAVLSAAIGSASVAAGAIIFYLGHRDARRAAARGRGLDFAAAGTGDGALFLVRGAF